MIIWCILSKSTVLAFTISGQTSMSWTVANVFQATSLQYTMIDIINVTWSKLSINDSVAQKSPCIYHWKSFIHSIGFSFSWHFFLLLLVNWLNSKQISIGIEITWKSKFFCYESQCDNFLNAYTLKKKKTN